MRKTFLLLTLIFITIAIFSQATTKTTIATRSVMTYSFQTAVFIKSVDSLHKERLLLDSLLSLNCRLLDTSYTRIDRFNAVIRYCNSNRAHCADSVNATVVKFDKEADEHNKLIKQINWHVSFFNELLPRITTRLQKFADDNSTGTKTVQIDWDTYIRVHHEFIDWGNYRIRQYHLNVSNMNAIKDQINEAINSMRK